MSILAPDRFLSVQNAHLDGLPVPGVRHSRAGDDDHHADRRHRPLGRRRRQPLRHRRRARPHAPRARERQRRLAPRRHARLAGRRARRRAPQRRAGRGPRPAADPRDARLGADLHRHRHRADRRLGGDGLPGLGRLARQRARCRRAGAADPLRVSRRRPGLRARPHRLRARVQMYGTNPLAAQFAGSTSRGCWSASTRSPASSPRPPASSS